MEGFITFVGTGGARVVASKQVRSTGGLWIQYEGTNLYIDPGPGALVRLHALRDHLEPSHLDGIILTHKHLDHANDVNLMIEAMADGGFRKKGVLFCPEDALSDDPVVLKYVRSYLEGIEVLQAGKRYTIKDISFSVPVRHIHPVEAYGLIFDFGKKVALISDTRYFEELPDHYAADVLIVNVLRTKPITANDPIDHLSVEDFKKVVARVRPEVAIMTHLGMTLIKEKPTEIAKALEQELGVRVIAAYDGMKWVL
jgi:phosphoribosyl 1,2-cyclic phosphodiesterase